MGDVVAYRITPIEALITMRRPRVALDSPHTADV